MFDKFIEEVEELLNSNQLLEVDIKPLIDNYLLKIEPTLFKESDFKSRINDLLLEMERDDLIASNKKFIGTLKIQLAGQYLDEPIVVRSTLKFKNYYMNKHKSFENIDNSITQNTYGHNSPIAGGNLTVKR